MKKCYRVDFVGNIECDYIWSDNDEEAIEKAMKMANDGIDYSDGSHCELQVLQVVEVDDNNEFFTEKRVIFV